MRAPAAGSRSRPSCGSSACGQRWGGIRVLLYQAIISHFRHGWASQRARSLPALIACCPPAGRGLVWVPRLFIWGLWAFPSPARFQGSERALRCVCSLVTGCEKGISVGGNKGRVWFFKTQIPLSKDYRFPAVPENNPNQMNSKAAQPLSGSFIPRAG